MSRGTSSRRSRHDSCRGNRSDVGRTSSLQHARAGFECRASRAHVVYEHDPKAPDVCPPGRAKGAADVRVTLRRRQVGLRRCRPNAAKQTPHRHADRRGNFLRLIEAAPSPSPGVERHGHEHVRGFEHAAAMAPHEMPERYGDRSAAVVFQGVQDRAQGAVVRADGRAGRERGRPPPAPHTERSFETDDTPGLERIAAACAQGRRERRYLRPAAGADGTARGFFKAPLAGGARGREEHGDEAVR